MGQNQVKSVRTAQTGWNQKHQQVSDVAHNQNLIRMTNCGWESKWSVDWSMTRWDHRSLFPSTKQFILVAEDDCFNWRVSEELKVIFNLEVKLKLNLFRNHGTWALIYKGGELWFIIWFKLFHIDQSYLHHLYIMIFKMVRNWQICIAAGRWLIFWKNTFFMFYFILLTVEEFDAWCLDVERYQVIKCVLWYISSPSMVELNYKGRNGLPANTKIVLR